MVGFMVWVMDSTTTLMRWHPLAVLVARMRARLGEEAGAAWWSMSDDDLTSLVGDLAGLGTKTRHAGTG